MKVEIMGQSIGITAARVAAYLNDKLHFERLVSPSSYKTDFEAFAIMGRLIPKTDLNYTRLLGIWLKTANNPEQLALIDKIVNKNNGYDVELAREMLKRCKKGYESLTAFYRKNSNSNSGTLQRQTLTEIGRRYLD